MNDTSKNDPNKMNEPNKTSTNQSGRDKGSGSDTVSAANISAGTSVGNAGQSPMPHAQGAGHGSSAQSSTLASHTSRPMGGNSSGGMSGTTMQNEQSRHQDRSARGSQAHGTSGSEGMMDGLQERARDAYEGASEWASDTYEQGSRRLRNVGTGSMRRMSGARRSMQNFVAENPVMVGVAGLAAGLLIGALLPRTRREDQIFGEWADEVRGQGMRYAQDMAQRGREYVEEAFSGEDPRFGSHETEWRPESGQPGSGRH